MDEPGFARTLSGCRVAIIGLGLMGGSLALALRDKCAEIIGVDTNAKALEFAQTHGIIDRAAELDAVLDCHLLVLATPVRTILSQLAYLSSLTPSEVRTAPLALLDLGSTKAEIISAMEKLPAGFDPIGGHPMCGKERSGITQAEAGLFQGKTFVLTPLARTLPAALALAHEMVTSIGAVPWLLSAERHDALAAVISHLPYVAAVALMRTAQSFDDEQVWALAASGFRDTSRLAVSDLTLSVDILITNRRAIVRALERYRAEMDSLLQLIEAGDDAALRAALAPAQAKRSSILFK
jgi:prephenate dehydrogenase